MLGTFVIACEHPFAGYINAPTSLANKSEENTMTKKTNNTRSLWYGHIADDQNGHQGSGATPEYAQAALEQAQRDDVPSAEHKCVTGWIINNDNPF